MTARKAAVTAFSDNKEGLEKKEDKVSGSGVLQMVTFFYACCKFGE